MEAVCVGVRAATSAGAVQSRVSFEGVIFGSGLGSQAGEMRARQSERPSPAAVWMASHASSAPAFRFVADRSGARYESTPGR